MTDPAKQPEHSKGRRSEASEPDVGRIALFAVGLFILMGVVLLVMSWMFTTLAGFQPEPESAASLWTEAQRLPPRPRLQVLPTQDLERTHREEQAMLDGYGWVDEQSGVVRIPIERAIEVLAQRGLPARSQGEEGRAPSDRNP